MFDYHALGCWLPLHDCPEEMGAMQFVPGSHTRGVLRHTPQFGDVKLHVLQAEGVDASNAVVCPLKKGGATFHHSRTLHHTAPNHTDRPRLAFPVEFETLPVRRQEPSHYEWVEEWRAVIDHTPSTTHPVDGKLVAV